MVARGEKPAADLCLSVSLREYENASLLGIFANEQIVCYRESTVGGQGGAYGLFRGEDMGNTFSQQRRNELG